MARKRFGKYKAKNGIVRVTVEDFEELLYILQMGQEMTERLSEERDKLRQDLMLTKIQLEKAEELIK